MATAVQSAGELKLDYLNLLVTQMRYQNPLEPMDSAQMTAQLAQISQLEQLATANQTFAKVLAAAEGDYAAGLLGKQVAFVPEGETQAVIGVVSGVERSGTDVLLCVGNYTVALDDIQVIAD